MTSLVLRQAQHLRNLPGFIVPIRERCSPNAGGGGETVLMGGICSMRLQISRQCFA